MIQKVLSFAEQHHMIKLGDHIVAGVSGGADSVCLLLVLAGLRAQLGLKLTVVHVEHGIRGGDSLEDMDFVLRLCEKMDIPCRVFSCRAKEYAKSRGMSLEEGARELRYGFFDQTVKETGAGKVAVAHNQNDCAETLLFHLARGTGLKGMSGIVPVRDHTIRPLLCVSRGEIEEYLREQGQPWRTDRSNLETEFSRNKLRHLALPVLEEVNTRAIAHIYQSAQIIAETQELLEGLVSSARSCHVREGMLSESVVQEASLVQRTLIHHLLAECAGSSRDITYIHVESVRQLLENQTGKRISLPYGMEANRTYGGILIKKKGPEVGAAEAGMHPSNSQTKREGRQISVEISSGETVTIPGTDLTLSCLLRKKAEEKQEIPQKTYTKWMDYDKIKGTLLLRTRQPGDCLVLDARGKKQKLKDYFINEKIPSGERDNIWLVADGSHILWIIGRRISAGVKVTEHTERILEIQVNGGKTDE